MLWSDDHPNELPDDIRRTLAKLRRAMIVIAMGAAVVMTLAMWHA